MAILSMAQVDLLQQLRIGQLVTPAVEDMKAQLAEALVAAAHPARLHHEEIAFSVEEDPKLARITARWAPQNRTVVELVGGPEDGTVMEVEDVAYGIQVPMGVSAPFVTYRRAGWNTESRRWVFRPQGGE